jgi:hemolysin III
VSHELAAFVAAPAALALVAGAETARARLAAAVYGATLFAQFCVSAAYHRPDWTPRARAVVERVDHSVIFLFTAGTYTPLCLRLGPGAGHVLLAALWGAAAVGVLFSVAWRGAPKPLRAGIHVLLGWSFLPFAPEMRSALGADAFRLLVGGTLVYTVGAIVFTVRRPDPVPETFGFHEIFHLLVIVGAACHYLVVRSALRGLG